VRKGLVAIAFWIIPLLGFCQQNYFANLITNSSSVADKAEQQFLKHIDRLKSKQSSKDLVFLRKIFWSTQQEFLKTYSPYGRFDEIFVSGKYDCLTATSLYSLLLEEFHFNYSIIETNYHIFIVVRTSAGDVLLETTDRYHGFVADKNEIQKRIGSYKQNLIASTNSNLYHYSFDLYKEVTLSQLNGLLHFNQAVNAFNKHEWLTCADELEQSEKIYQSPRVKELAVLLVQSVLAAEVKDEIKEQILLRFKNHWIERQPTVAIND